MGWNLGKKSADLRRESRAASESTNEYAFNHYTTTGKFAMNAATASGRILRRFAIALVALVLLGPQTGLGGPIESAWIDLKIEEPTLIAFGTDGCELFWDFVTEISVNGTPIPDMGGELTFSTPTLLSLTTYDDGAGNITASSYEFGAGSAWLRSWWGSWWHGELRGVSVYIYHENPPYDSIGYVSASFGPGTFDDAFADALGVIPQTADGWFYMGVDQVDGDPSWGRRVGGSTSGIDYGGLSGADLPSPVPEPQTWSLLLVGVASLIGWKVWGEAACRRQNAGTSPEEEGGDM